MEINYIWIGGNLEVDTEEVIEMLLCCIKCKTNTIPILCTRCAFRLILFSGTQAEKLEIQNNCKNCQRAGKKKQPRILRQENEPNPSKDRAMHEGDNPSF
jgi:hypothetical protein